MAKNITWAVLADGNTCKIYLYETKPPQLILLKEIQHPENKLKDIDLTSDKPGHYASSSGMHGVYSQPSDPKEVHISRFAKEIAEALNNGRINHAYSHMVMVSPPHMNGLILKNLNKNVTDLITHNIKKDFLHLEERNLFEFIQANIEE